jgi:hypothetical protein
VSWSTPRARAGQARPWRARHSTCTCKVSPERSAKCATVAPARCAATIHCGPRDVRAEARVRAVSFLPARSVPTPLQDISTIYIYIDISTINVQLSTINISTINVQLSTSQLSTSAPAGPPQTSWTRCRRRAPPAVARAAAVSTTGCARLSATSSALAAAGVGACLLGVHVRESVAKARLTRTAWPFRPAGAGASLGVGWRSHCVGGRLGSSLRRFVLQRRAQIRTSSRSGTSLSFVGPHMKVWQRWGDAGVQMACAGPRPAEGGLG